MKVTLFAHGTRGDIAPMVALGWQLARHGQDVTIAIPDELRELAARAGMDTAPLPLDTIAWLHTSEGQRLLHTGGTALVRGLSLEYERNADAFDAAYEAAAAGADAFVGNHITGDRALALGDARQVPVAFFVPFPLTPSGEYASLIMSRGKLRSPRLRRASHELFHRLWWRRTADSIQAFRRKLGLPRQTEPTYRRVLRDDRLLVLYALSPHLFPRPTDWPAHIKATPTWAMPEALREDLGESLPADLERWLDAGDPPVFLGFGSMPVIEPEPLLDDIAAVTEALGLRAIVSENCVAADAAGSVPAHLRVVGAVDHDRLFPRCAAIVHHGGIGSTHASLRAGRPTMVCSVFGDQPWWGEQMKRLGVGTHVPFRKLDRGRLESGLRTLLDPGVRARAQTLGAAIQAEGDGLPEATRLFEEWLSAVDASGGDRSPAASRQGLSPALRR